MPLKLRVNRKGSALGFDEPDNNPKGDHYKAYDLQKAHPTWKKMTPETRREIEKRAQDYEHQRK